MILNRETKNIETFGDIQEFKTSIDPKNLELITTLLSSNLYSKPEQSFIREIVSNAWDSHVEAKTTDTPIIISVTKNINNEYLRDISIRDYGTGLSPERFRDIYCNIGSSTKRESNDYIGAFGLGRFSALACSNTVYITSYYEGTAYYYVMIKDGNNITINLFDTIPTKERNGLDVCIKGISNIDRYTTCFYDIIYFPNVYINSTPDIYRGSINNTKIKHFKNFAVSNSPAENLILLGNVLYPHNASALPTEIIYFFNKIAYSGIVLKFDIDELEITPNRESIIYNKATIDKIVERVKAAEKELDEYISKKLPQNFTNIIEYLKWVTCSMYYNPLEDTLGTYSGYRIDKNKHKVTFKGTLINIGSSYYTIAHETIVNFKGLIFDEAVYTNKIPYNKQEYVYLDKIKILTCSPNTRLTPLIKNYLRENYSGYCIITEPTKQDIYNHYGPAIRIENPNEQTSNLILDSIYEYIISHSIKIDFNTDPNFLKYKEESKTKTLKVTRRVPYIILHDQCTIHSSKTVKFNDIDSALKYITSLKSGIVLVDTSTDIEDIKYLIPVKRIHIIYAKQSTIKTLKSYNLPCFVNLDYLLTQDPLLAKVNTVRNYFNTYQDAFANLKNILPKPIVQDLNEIRKYIEFSKCYCSYTQRATNLNLIDSDLDIKCKRLKDICNQYDKIRCNINEHEFFSCELFIAWIALKTKSFRINYDTYRRIKNNPIIQLLCTK